MIVCKKGAHAITVIILTERYIQSSGRNSIFGIFVNPIMRKAATLIIFVCINLTHSTVDS